MSEYTEQELSDEQIAKKLVIDMIERRADQKNTLQWQMDMSLTVANILMHTGGFYYNDKEKVIMTHQNASMNYTGVIRLAEILHGYLNKDTISSNLSMGEIRRIMLGLNKDVKLELYINRKKYGVDMQRFPVMVGFILNSVFLALKRAYNDGTRTYNSTLMRYYEQTRGTENKEGQGGLFAWGKNGG